METARVTFKTLIQDSQDFGSDNDHMISRVFFDLEVGGRRYDDLHVDLKQIVGSSIESDPIEVGRVIGYSGPMNYEMFRDEAEKYFRSLIGSSGAGIHIQGASNIRMRNNTFEASCTVELPVTRDGGW